MTHHRRRNKYGQEVQQNRCTYSQSGVMVKTKMEVDIGDVRYAAEKYLVGVKWQWIWIPAKLTGPESKNSSAAAPSWYLKRSSEANCGLL